MATTKKTADGPLSDAELDMARRRLIELQRTVETRRAAINRDVGSGLSADSKERAVQMENAEVLDELAADADLSLGEVKRALVRLENGQYGLCVECGEEIGRQRLLARPQATVCIDCAQRSEPAPG